MQKVNSIRKGPPPQMDSWTHRRGHDLSTCFNVCSIKKHECEVAHTQRRQRYMNHTHTHRHTHTDIRVKSKTLNRGVSDHFGSSLLELNASIPQACIHFDVYTADSSRGSNSIWVWKELIKNKMSFRFLNNQTVTVLFLII